MMATATPLRRAKRGFTLIEMAIVLVIIGLIVGGLMAGSALIKHGELRSSVAQIQRSDAAVQTFKLKYNQLPGDIKGVKYGLSSFYGGSNSAYEGDEDGKICSYTALGCSLWEFQNTWHHLKQAGLIQDKYIDGGYVTGPALRLKENTSFLYFAYLAPYYPAAGNSHYLIVDSSGHPNTNPQPTGIQFYNNPLTAQEAFDIDSKMDDGLPDSGIVTASGYWGGGAIVPQYKTPKLLSVYSATTACVSDSSSPYRYLLTNPNATCDLSVRMSF